MQEFSFGQSQQIQTNPFGDYEFIQRDFDEETQQYKIRAKYLRIKTLGCGSFGNCYQVLKTYCEDNFGVGRRYALKEIIVKYKQGKEYEREKKKFQQEVNIMAQISLSQHNKYFTSISHRWRDKQRFYIVMNYEPNGTLKDYQNYLIENGSWYSQQQIVYFGYHILKALSALHSMKYMHRDIKQANILLDKDLNIKICDFGQTSNIQLQKYYDVGSPFFKAPEIVQIKLSKGQKNITYSQKVDIWALGVMLFHMIYKQYPFNGERQKVKSQKILCQQIQNEFVIYQLPSVSQNSDELIELVKLMLQKDPKKRWLSQKLLKKSIFKGIQKNEKKIIQSIRKKRNFYKIQVKQIFYIQRLGYFIVLQNSKRYLLKDRGEIIQFTNDFDNFLSEQKSLSNEQIKQKLKLLNQNQLKDLKYLCKILQNGYSKQRNILQLKFSFFNMKDNSVAIRNIVVIRRNIVMVKLSNYVIQFFFGKQQSKCNTLIFQTIVSFNYNNSNQNKSEIFFISKKYEPNGRKFSSLDQAMKHPKLKQKISYIIQIFHLQIDNTDISLRELNLQRVAAN